MYEQPPHTSGSSDLEVSTSAAAAPRHRVLVIDDSVLIREAVKIALQSSAGWDLLCAENGQQGIEIAIAEQPEAILLDVSMPGMDGFAVIDALRATPSVNAIPIVLLTGRDHPAGHEHGALAGVIPKPFAIDSLAGRLTALLGWAS